MKIKYCYIHHLWPSKPDPGQEEQRKKEAAQGWRRISIRPSTEEHEGERDSATPGIARTTMAQA